MMANPAHQNFTNRLVEGPDTAARILELHHRIENAKDQIDGVPPGSRGGRMQTHITRRLLSGERISLGNPRIRDERAAAALDQEFFRAAEKGDDVAILAFLFAGFDPNMKRTRSSDTVLHIAATRDARDVVRVLIESGKCDYLIRDRHGNLASTNAYLYGRNPALARLLSIKERKQAEEQGLPYPPQT